MTTAPNRSATGHGRRRAPAGALVCALLVAACGSTPPTRYYTLAGPVAPVPHAPAVQIAVAPVTVPEGLARPQLVIRRAPDEASGRVEVLEQSRWTGSFDTALREAFADGIATALGARDASHGDELADAPLWRVAIQLRRYDAVPGERVAMTVGWVFGRSDRAVQHACQDSRSVALSGRGPDDVVRGIRAVVAGLADEIAAQIRRAGAVGAPAAGRPAGPERGPCDTPASG